MTVQLGVIETLGYKVESALGTADLSTAEEIRFTDLAGPAQTRQLADNPTTGHAHPYDASDSRPVPYQVVQPDALSFGVEVRRAAAADTDPPLAVAMASGGCEVKRSSKTTITAVTSSTVFSTGSISSVAPPHLAILVPLPDGRLVPSLIMARNVGTGECTPVIALPAAPDNGKTVEVMTTIHPALQQVPATTTLSFRRSTPMTYSGGANKVAWDYRGCALGKGPTVEIVPSGSVVKVPLSFHVAKTEITDVAFAVETFVDSEKMVVTNDALIVDLVTHASAGRVASAPLYIYSLSLDTGFTVEPIRAGGAGSYGGIQGYMHVPGVPMLSITADFDPRFITALQADQTLRCCGIVQPVTNVASPALGIWAHNLHVVGDDGITVDHTGKSYVTATLKLRCASGRYTSTANTLTASAWAPWHIAVSGQGA
jgi:hypothetical protein